MDLTNKYLGRAGLGRGGVGALVLSPSLPPSKDKNTRGGSGHLDVFLKTKHIFCGMASLIKVFLKKNASFAKYAKYDLDPPPRPASLTMNEQQNSK